MDLDLPVPVDEVPEALTRLPDEFENPISLPMAFIGLGQGGGRMAEAFYKLGYRKVFAINTTQTDLIALDIPESQKHCLNVGGAGKDLDAAEAAAYAAKEEIQSFLARHMGADIPLRVCLCFGAGGGSGAGMVRAMVQILSDYRVAIAPGTVGVWPMLLVGWPKATEGVKPRENASRVAEWMKNSPVGPTLVIDNDQVLKLYKPSASAEYATGNMALAKLLHAFNTLSSESSEHTAFDAADFKQMLVGTVAFGSQVIKDWGTGTAIADAIRKSVAVSLLAPVDVKTADRAGLVLVCGPDAYEQVSAEALDEAFAMMTRLVKPGTTVFRGVYKGEKPGMVALFGLGGLVWPYK